MNPVLDACLFVAAISPAERHHQQARALFESHSDDVPFLVPALFRVEVMSALSRRGEAAEFLDLVDAIVRGPRFHGCPVDGPLLDLAAEVARETRLRAYDAIYVALAITAGAPLWTLDREIQARIEATRPAVTVRCLV